MFSRLGGVFIEIENVLESPVQPFAIEITGVPILHRVRGHRVVEYTDVHLARWH
jgi:hypothetical protein